MEEERKVKKGKDKIAVDTNDDNTSEKRMSIDKTNTGGVSEEEASKKRTGIEETNNREGKTDIQLDTTM